MLPTLCNILPISSSTYFIAGHQALSDEGKQNVLLTSFMIQENTGTFPRQTHRTNNRAAPDRGTALSCNICSVSLRYDLIVCVRCELVDHRIEDSAYEHADSRTYEEQRHIVVAKEL